jgi:hypothetical protein
MPTGPGVFFAFWDKDAEAPPLREAFGAYVGIGLDRLIQHTVEAVDEGGWVF